MKCFFHTSYAFCFYTPRNYDLIERHWFFLKETVIEQNKNEPSVKTPLFFYAREIN